MTTLIWEPVKTLFHNPLHEEGVNNPFLPDVPGIVRSKVPGGWLVKYLTNIIFYPDPTHEWGKAE